MLRQGAALRRRTAGGSALGLDFQPVFAFVDAELNQFTLLLSSLCFFDLLGLFARFLRVRQPIGVVRTFQ